MDNRFSTWKRDSRRGNYSILMGTMVMAIMGFAALAVDISLITMAELQAQAAADASSHAALIAYRVNKSTGDGNAAANFIVGRNPVAMGIANIDNIEYGSYDHDTQVFCVGCSGIGNVNAVRVNLSRKDGNAVDLLLAPMFGVLTHNVDANSITAQQQRAIMLVQDASCSMMPGAIDVARDANIVFLDHLKNFPQAGDMLGLAMYASYGAGTKGTNSGTSANPANGVAPWAPLVEIAPNEADLRDSINGICDTYYGSPCPGSDNPTYAEIDQMTNPGVAMEQAIGQIATRTDQTYFRGMVVFSDGYFNFGGGNGRALDAATEAWDNYDIHVWTILYSNGGGDPDVMGDMVRGIGFFENTPSVSALPGIYKDVAESIPTVYVD